MTPVGSVLYAVESAESREAAEADLASNTPECSVAALLAPPLPRGGREAAPAGETKESPHEQ